MKGNKKTWDTIVFGVNAAPDCSPGHAQLFKEIFYIYYCLVVVIEHLKSAQHQTCSPDTTHGTYAGTTAPACQVRGSDRWLSLQLQTTPVLKNPNSAHTHRHSGESGAQELCSSWGGGAGSQRWIWIKLGWEVYPRGISRCATSA